MVILMNVLSLSQTNAAVSVNLINIDWNALFVVINLVIFYLLMKKFLWGPICKAMDARKAKIDEQFKKASDAEEQANRMKDEYGKKLSDVHDESDRILNTAKTNARAEYGRIIDEANSGARKIIDDARVQIEKEKKSAIYDIRVDIAGVAMNAAAKIIGK